MDFACDKYTVYAATGTASARGFDRTLAGQEPHPNEHDNLGRMSNLMLVRSVRIYSTVHLTESLYERGRPAARADS